MKAAGWVDSKVGMKDVWLVDHLAESMAVKMVEMLVGSQVE